LLLLPIVALISYSLAHQFGATGEAAALLTALGTVGADRLVKLYTDRFFAQIATATADQDALASTTTFRPQAENAASS